MKPIPLLKPFPAPRQTRLASALPFLLVSLAMLAPLSLPAAPSSPRRDSSVEAVETVMPAVVNIATQTIVPTRDPWENLFREFFDPYYRRRPPNTQYSLGSGVIIDETGIILTSYHVIARASRIQVKLADGRDFEAEKVAGASSSDLALLKIRAPDEERFHAVTFAQDDDLLLGETVLALGNPFGLGGSVSRGILSSKSRRPPLENEPLDVPDWLQTDAAINPGNSGGPLINLEGRMIGINVAIYKDGQGIGFAIPIKRVSTAISEAYSPESLQQLWFGARLRPGAPPLRVLSVQLESPAGRAGLRAGDLVLKINDQAPAGFIDFNRRLLQLKDDHDISLLIQRKNRDRTVTLRMIPEKTFFNADLIRKKTGASLQLSTPELALRLRLPNAAGLIIAGVEKGSPAAHSDLERGMLLTAIDGQSVSSLIEAAKILHAKPKGEKARLDVIVPRQRGPFIEYHAGTAELVLD